MKFLKKNLLFHCIVLFIHTAVTAQDTLSVTQDSASVSAPDSIYKYPQGYFRNPLNVPLQLSANFGELRTNHFHMGFDIRTNQKENLPVYAAAEGYISRVKIEKEGFGRAIYITHPNGYTTLYAHLNDFYKELNDSVKQIQYNSQKWEQDTAFAPEAFPVTKGQFIAFSGNTGASRGPHLHFEIRDAETGNNINPWLFDFGLPDYIPPFIYRLYLYDRRFSTYQAAPKGIGIRGAKGNYTTIANEVVVSTPRFSFGVTAEDKTNTSPFLFGIYGAELLIDDTLRSSFTLDDFSYDETRYLNASIDYKTRYNGGPYIQHLSRLPGNRSSIFSRETGDGIIELTDTVVHEALINIKDAAGNLSSLRFRLRYDSSKKQDLFFPANTVALIPNQKNEIQQDDIQLFFSDKAVYDTIPFLLKSVEAEGSKIVSNIYSLHNHTIPIHDSFTVRIKNTKEIPDSLKDKVVMQLISNRKVVVEKREWIDGRLEGKFRDLGVVKLFIDTLAPRIALSGWRNGGSVRNLRSIALLVKDDAGDIKKFTALLDGQWLMFSRKDNYFIYKFDEHCPEGRHELKITAEDEAGNVAERTYNFTR